MLYGGGHGLGGAATELWHQESGGLPGKNDAADEFGRGVWIMDDNLDGFGDLLAYSAGDDAFYVIYGSPAGLTSDGAHSRRVREGPVARCLHLGMRACLVAPPAWAGVRLWCMRDLAKDATRSMPELWLSPIGQGRPPQATGPKRIA